MKTRKKICLWIWVLILLIVLIFAGLFLFKEYRIKETFSYCSNGFKEGLWDSFRSITMTNVNKYSEYINFTWIVKTEWSIYEFTCSIYNKDHIEVDMQRISDNWDSKISPYNSFRSLLLKPNDEFKSLIFNQ